MFYARINVLKPKGAEGRGGVEICTLPGHYHHGSKNGNIPYLGKSINIKISTPQTDHVGGHVTLITLIRCIIMSSSANTC